MDKYIGRYHNPEYDNASNFSRNYIELSYMDENTLKMIVNISCGSKVLPAIYEVTISDCYFDEFRLIYGGSSQCSMGDDPTFYVDEKRVEIYTNIWTPGFDGHYVFSREE